jgi:alkanesulfonate monooxygenase SsuD/methylene tetrahydromethanopterin reductase-like flavin-dependent oxidoreductase (luciferase family)
MGDARPDEGRRVDFAAGRGYDRREYGPFKVSFEDNQAIFEEGMDVVQRLWSSDSPISHHGKHYQFDNVAITPKPVQRPIPAYVACSRSLRSSSPAGSAAASSSHPSPPR